MNLLTIGLELTDRWLWQWRVNQKTVRSLSQLSQLAVTGFWEEPATTLLVTEN